MKKNPKRVPANCLRRVAYQYILKVGYQEFVNQWNSTFDQSAANNDELNIIVFCAANVEPLHKKTYGEHAEENTYLKTFKRMQIIEICNERFIGYTGTNLYAQFYNIEYRALKKAAHLASMEHEVSMLGAPESKSLSTSTTVESASEVTTKTPSKDETMLHVLQCYYEFIENIVDARKYPWFSDVKLEIDPGNKFTTLTITANYLDKIKDCIENKLKDMEDKRTVAKQFSIEDSDIIDKIVSLIRSTR